MMAVTDTYRNKAPKVAEILARDIHQGKYVPGTLLPTDQALAREYSVSRITMRRVLALLADKGQVVRLPQKGVLVPVKSSEMPDSLVDAPSSAAARKTTLAAVWAAEPDSNIVGISDGIKQYSRENGLEFQVHLFSEGYTRAVEVLRNVRNLDIQGIVIFAYDDPEYFQAIRCLGEARFPVVCISRTLGDLWSSSVDSDNAAGVYQATQYLIEKYSRPVYAIQGQPRHQSNIERYTGYCRAMEDADYGNLVKANTIEIDISESDPAYWPTSKKNHAGVVAGERLFQMAKPPLSVVCNNDYVARGVYLAAEKHGYTVGQDVAIVGFDDMPMARLLNPPLTTVRQVSRQTGYTAARLLHQLITGKVTSPQSIHLPVELVIRDSA